MCQIEFKTLFKSITLFHGTHRIFLNVSHIWSECQKCPEIFCGLLLVPQINVVDLNNVKLAIASSMVDKNWEGSCAP